MVRGRRLQQTFQRRRGLFVALLWLVLSFRIIRLPMMSWESSLAAAKLCSLGSNSSYLSLFVVRKVTLCTLSKPFDILRNIDFDFNRRTQFLRLWGDLSQLAYCILLSNTCDSEIDEIFVVQGIIVLIIDIKNNYNNKKFTHFWSATLTNKMDYITEDLTYSQLKNDSRPRDTETSPRN